MSRINYVINNKIQQVEKKIKRKDKSDKDKINMLMFELAKAYLENAKLKMRICGIKDLNKPLCTDGKSIDPIDNKRTSIN